MTSSLQIVAKTLYGLEAVLADEITALGGQEISLQNRAVSFVGDRRLLYAANLKLRTALRVLRPILTFTATNDDQLYRKIQEVDWAAYLSPADTLAVDCFASSQHFQHSKFVALRIKDAIVDQFRERQGVRPSVDVVSPTLRLNAHVSHDQCTIALDSSGDSLHKRGYRLDKTQAPLNEVLAAGMVLLSGWDRKSPFVDPMCGSGTIAIEAAMLAQNRAPGLCRDNFGLMRWRDFDEVLWQAVKQSAQAQNQDTKGEIVASDRSEKAVRIARENAARAGVADAIHFSASPFDRLAVAAGNGTLITNPPYGERMQRSDLLALYKALGDHLKQSYTGFDAWILSGNKQALKHIGLRPSKKIKLYNGPIECSFQRYHLYEGSIKQKYRREEG